MPVDVAGVRRIGMFEEVHDQITGATFRQTSGRGKVSQFEVTQGGSGPFVAKNINDPSYLGYKAQAAGAAPMEDVFSMPAPKRTTL